MSLIEVLLFSVITSATIPIASTNILIGDFPLYEENCGEVELPYSCSIAGADVAWSVIYPGREDAHTLDTSQTSRFAVKDGSLLIGHAKQVDSGKYRCEGNTWIYLHVRGNEVYTWAPPADTTVEAFHNVTLLCRVDGTTREDVSWYFGEKLIAMTKDRFQWASNKPDNYDLQILNAKPADSGEYGCRLKASQVEAKARLEIQKALLHYYNITRVQKEENQAAKLICPGFPSDSNTQHVIWLYENSSVIYAGSQMTPGQDANGMHYLQIDKVKKSHAQIFYCVSLRKNVSLMNGVRLQIRGCPEGYVDAGNGKCYKLFKEKKTYMQAEQTCRGNHGGHLATPGRLPDGKFDKNKLKEDLKKVTGLSEMTWIGMDSIGKSHHEMSWPDGRAVQSPTQENDLTMAMARQWRFNRLMHFICEVPIVDYWKSHQRQKRRCPDGWMYFQCDRYCYRLYNENITSAAAVRECYKKGGDIAMPKTTRQHRSVLMMVNNTRAWVGMVVSRWPEYRDGTSIQIDIRWLQTRYSRGKQCIAMTTDDFDFSKCEDKLPYICQIDKVAPGPPCENTLLGADDKKAKNTLNGSAQGVYPWIAHIYNTGAEKYICGGVLISDIHVLTAAGCLYDNFRRFGRHNMEVYLGSENSADWPQNARFGVTQEYIHPDFIPSHSPTEYNIAVLELSSRVYTGCSNNTEQACLPDKTSYEDAFCLDTSWTRGGLLQYCAVDMTSVQQQGDNLVVPGCQHKASDGVVRLGGNPLMCTTPGVRWDVVGVSQGDSKFTIVKEFIPWIENVTKEVNSSDLGAPRIHHIEICEDHTATWWCPHGDLLGMRITKVTVDRKSKNNCYYTNPRPVDGCKQEQMSKVNRKALAYVSKECPKGSWNCTLHGRTVRLASGLVCDYPAVTTVWYQCNGPFLMNHTYKAWGSTEKKVHPDDQGFWVVDPRTYWAHTIRFDCGDDAWDHGYQIAVNKAIFTAPYYYDYDCKKEHSATSKIAARCNGKAVCKFLLHKSVDSQYCKTDGGDPIAADFYAEWHCVKKNLTNYAGTVDECGVLSGKQIQPSGKLVMMSVAAVLFCYITNDF